MAVLALAEGALGAMLDPRGPGEADHIHLVQAGLGDVVADGVGLARVGHAAPAALAVWQDAELTLGLRTGQGPAVGLPLQAAALPAVLDPGVSAVVQGLPVLMEALTAQPWVTFRAAEKINRGILTVTDHPSAHYKPVLTRAHRAPVILQHPDLTAVLDFPTMEAVPRAVLPVRAPAVVSTIQVKANGVVGTAVPARPALIDIFAGLAAGRKQPAVVVAVSALAVVPAGQIDAAGTAVTLDEALGALVDVCLTAGPGEALRAGTHISCNTSASVPTAIFAKRFARSSVPCVAWLAHTVVPSNGIEAQSILITAMLVCDTLIMFCTRIVVDPDVPGFADAHEGPRGVDAHRVLAAVMAPFSALVDVFTVRIVLSECPETISTATNGPVIQISADRILHAVMPFRTKVITFTNFATAVGQGNLMRLCAIQDGAAWTLSQLHALVLALIKNTSSRRGIDGISLSFKVGSSLKLAYWFAFFTALAMHVGKGRPRGTRGHRADQRVALDGPIHTRAVLAAVCPGLELSVGGPLPGAGPFTVALIQSVHPLFSPGQLGRCFG